MVAALQAGKPARTVPAPDDAPDAAQLLGSLTAKPVLFVANVDEGDVEVPPAIAEYARRAGRRCRCRLGAARGGARRAPRPTRRRRCGQTWGSRESGLQTVVRGAFSLLELIAFFTAGEDKPAQSWHLRRGLTAWHAAGQIHSDIQKGFVRAEVVSWDALVRYGGYAGAREHAALRLEGRDYLMSDGDVITVKFTP